MLPPWGWKGGGQVVSAACHTQKIRYQGADTVEPGCGGPMNGSLLRVLHGGGDSRRQGTGSVWTTSS